MLTSDFDFDLPKEFIAQKPAVPRDSSKLFVYHAKEDRVEHCIFRDIKRFLGKKDALVVNRSRVIPARILFDFEGKECEFFILERRDNGCYQCLVRPGKKFAVGAVGVINVDGGEVLKWKIVASLDDGSRVVQFVLKGSLDFKYEGGQNTSGQHASDMEFMTEHVHKLLMKIGKLPLPPYISGEESVDDQYQTVYSQEEGSVAAPTAGLHFTPELIADLNAQKVSFQEVILHVGRGTFLPVKADDVSEHIMHSEQYIMPESVADFLNAHRAAGGRVTAVGTTSVRVLESSFAIDKKALVAGAGDTDIFIYPDAYEWQVVDQLITNFHLPKSTLVMLVASFLESKGCLNPVEKVLELYELAKANNYRFYSFGDAMMIV